MPILTEALEYKAWVALCLAALRDFRLTLLVVLTAMGGAGTGAGSMIRGAGTRERYCRMSSVPWRVVLDVGMDRPWGRVRQAVGRGSEVFTWVGRVMLGEG